MLEKYHDVTTDKSDREEAVPALHQRILGFPLFPLIVLKLQLFFWFQRMDLKELDMRFFGGKEGGGKREREVKGQKGIEDFSVKSQRKEKGERRRRKRSHGSKENDMRIEKAGKLERLRLFSMERATLPLLVVLCQGVRERGITISVEGGKLRDQGASERLERREDEKLRKGLGRERLERRKGMGILC